MLELYHFLFLTKDCFAVSPYHCDMIMKQNFLRIRKNNPNLNITEPMDNIRILVVEDDKPFALEIEMMIADLGYEHLGNYANSEDAIDAIHEYQPDLIIMDINIQGEKNGIDIASQFSPKKIPLIFITAFESKNYFERAKLTAPAAYLVKPFKMLTLQNTIELAVMKMHRPELDNQGAWTDNISPQGTVFIKMNNILRKIHVHDIYWMEVSGNYSYLFTKEKKYILKMSLKNLLKNVTPHANFIRVHKQYVVQVRCIDSVNPGKNILKIRDAAIPIGRRFKKDLLEQIQSL